MTKRQEPNDSNKKRKYIKRTFKNLSDAEKRRKIDAQAQRVREIEGTVQDCLWKRADALAALIDLFYNCYGKKLKSTKLKELSGIDRNGHRLVMYAKLADYFPAELRKKDVGLRVYESAYKFNKRLKSLGRKEFSPAELVAEMEPRRGAAETKERLKNNAWRRDRKPYIDQFKKNRAEMLSNPKSAVENVKKWIRLVDVDPSHAIAAAIFTIHDDISKMSVLNNALEKLGLKFRVRQPSDKYFSTYYQPDLFDPDENYDVG